MRAIYANGTESNLLRRRLHNLNRMKLENIFHRLFGAAQLDLPIEDRFGNSVKPREWFLVPLHVIDQVVQRIQDGSITRTTHDLNTAQLIEDCWQ